MMVDNIQNEEQGGGDIERLLKAVKTAVLPSNACKEYFQSNPFSCALVRKNK